MLIELQVIAQAAQLTLNTKRTGLVAEIESPQPIPGRLAGAKSNASCETFTGPHARHGSNNAARPSAPPICFEEWPRGHQGHSSFDGMINPALGMSG